MISLTSFSGTPLPLLAAASRSAIPMAVYTAMPLYERRHKPHPTSVEDDIRRELMRIALDGFLPMAILSSVCMVGAMAIIASVYRDPWMWTAAALTLPIALARLAVIVLFQARSKQNPEIRFLVWATVFSGITVLFCAMMAIVTLYNFQAHDGTVQMLCVIGTYTLSSGISSRLGLQPRVSQACIVMMQSVLGYALMETPNPILRLSAVLTAATAMAYCVSIHKQYKVFDEQVRIRLRLRNLANHDALTGLPNRLQFEGTFARLCAARTPFTLWMLDLDGFKGVNDTYGHDAGDDLLRQVARRLERAVRSGDLLARLGGDEFVILQPMRHAPGDTTRLAQRIRDEVSADYLVDGQRVHIGVSIGIKRAYNGLVSPEIAMREVDEALYRVKELGEGGFLFV